MKVYVIIFYLTQKNGILRGSGKSLIGIYYLIIKELCFILREGITKDTQSIKKIQKHNKLFAIDIK